MQYLNNLKVKELYVLASQNKIKNYKKFRKQELIEALQTILATIKTSSIAVPQESSVVKEVKKEKLIKNSYTKPLSFRFDNNRANINDKFKKRIGDDYIQMQIVEKNDKSVTMLSSNGIKVKVKK